MRNIFYAITMAAMVLLTGACTQDEQPSLPKGNITFAIAQASEPVATQHTATRATPAQLGKPLADKFMLTIMHTGGIKPVYDGPFVESLTVEPGEFDISARCGEDVKIGRDTPYYTGYTQATVRPGKPTSAVIPCRVANALVSVRFGRNAEEKARLDKFYSDYAVTVTVGQESMDITSAQEATSIYFPAGSSPRLTFHGKLKELQGKEVSFDLQSPSLPTTFQAADHGIVTITLPNPESSFIVEIGKAEMQTVTIEGSIPVTWFPVPEAHVTQVFGEDGLYYGTTVSFTDTYPGSTWKAELTSSDGTVLRTVSGVGALTSDCHTEQNHPCLTAGEYKAIYYIIQGDAEQRIASRPITILNPDLKLTVGGYTSHTKYKNGDIDGANACDAYTVYAPSASLNISEELLAKCPHTFSLTYEGQVHTQPGKNSIVLPNQTQVKANFTPYVLIAKAEFAGISMEKSLQFFITGLPGNFTPPTEATEATGGFGWTYDGPAVWFEPTYVQLGKNVTRGQSITNNGFAVPKGTSVQLDYDVIVRGGDLFKGTSLTLSMGDDKLFEQHHKSFAGKDYPYTGTKVFNVSADASKFTCSNSNGAGQNASYINSIVLNYAK